MRARWPLAPLVVLVTGLLALAGCSADGPASAAAGIQDGAATPAVATTATIAATPPPKISLGPGGLVVFPDAATAWVAAHPSDGRTALIKARIANQPTALWLTGNESFGNLNRAVALAKTRNGTLTLTLWNVPLRYDGLSAPTSTSLASYESWVSKVARTIGSTRVIMILEPDALWFYDRMPTASSKATRITALNYAISALAKYAPNTRVYIDAGTSSGSVTPERMATLLVLAGLKKADGFAVNVSSYSPTTQITAYAQRIRLSLQLKGIADPRYVIDSGRNGAKQWNFDWCNPTSQRLGTPPSLVSSKNGLDLDLWVKAPGTSDGDCGPSGGGKGTTGGQFLPSVADKMITG